MEGVRRPWLLGLTLAAITVAVAVLLLRSEPSGTGATNVGDTNAEPPRPARPDPPAPRAGESEPRRVRRCEPTESNPGGTNNYIPGAPPVESLGQGFIITGRVIAARGCTPLEGVRVQIWLATETGGEQDNRASVTTDAAGRYRIETAPTVAQFGEPNIHVAYDDGEYRDVFIRRVVDLDDRRAVVDLTLARG